MILLQQVGQVMLALPHAIALMGLRAACVVIPCYTLVSMWTMHLLTALFVEHKARKVGICPPASPLHRTTLSCTSLLCRTRHAFPGGAAAL